MPKPCHMESFEKPQTVVTDGLQFAAVAALT
jgi:hypothetical protein